MIENGQKTLENASKDMVKNKSPILGQFGHGTIVPFGQVIIKENFHVVFEIGGVFAASLVDVLHGSHRHAQARRGFGLLHELPRDVHGVEDHPLAGAGDVREYVVLDRIVLRTVRWIVRDPHLQSQPICEPLEVCLEQVVRGAVAPAPVAQDQQPGRPGMRRAPRLLPPQRDAVTT